MRYLLSMCGITITAIALGAVAPGAVAQENAITFTCLNVGNGPPEPLGDREGHAISVGNYSCLANSGPLNGGVWTETIGWEWDKAGAVIISAVGVVRKPGFTTMVKIEEGKIERIITDGKTTGFTGSGHGTFPVAVGGSPSLAGKSFNYSVKTTGFNQFTLDMNVE